MGKWRRTGTGEGKETKLRSDEKTGRRGREKMKGERSSASSSYAL